MLQPLRSPVYIVLVGITLSSPTLCLLADDGRQQPAGPEKIDLTDLPTPPDPLAELIKRGNVTFYVGERAPAARPDAPGRGGAKLGAETQYQLGFDYRCRSRWRIVNSAGQRQLSINVSYQRIKLNLSHEVWLRKRPESTGFWDNRLVLHELDHVRLSSDPTIEKRFIEALRRGNVISEEIDGNSKVTDSRVREIIDRHAQKIFAETIELINIRYQELDRQTDHGLRPLPADSSLSQWLR